MPSQHPASVIDARGNFPPGISAFTTTHAAGWPMSVRLWYSAGTGISPAGVFS